MNRSYFVKLAIAENREEDVVWSRHVEPTLVGLPENVLRICYYGFTEMFNNVIDHSGAETSTVSVTIDDEEVTIIISDDGIGIFEKVKQGLGLANHHQAIFELHKGITTDPARHSGQGIFFTSRAFDVFTIASGGLLFGHTPTSKDLLLDHETRGGTTVDMSIDPKSDRKLASVFDEFSSIEEGFTKTHIVVAMAKQGGGDLISRSQAKRVLAQCERFREIVLDFEGVDFIGQGFADEMFRVFRRQNPDVMLHPIHANDRVAAMIRRAEKPPAPTYESIAEGANAEPLLETARRLDADLLEWRLRGMRGTPEERERFEKELFHGARMSMRLLIVGKLATEPDKPPREILEAAIPEMLEFSRRQAIDSGLDDEETDLYVKIQAAAYETLRQELGT